jgi:hypothetical protein
MKTKIKTITQHEGEYWHIRKLSWKSIGIKLSGLVLLFLSFLSIKLIIYKWKDLDLNVLFKCEEDCFQFANILQLDICFNLIITSIFILFGIVGLFNLYKRINWSKLIEGLIVGLIWGLIWGLIGGLIVGLIGGLIVGLIGVLEEEI